MVERNRERSGKRAALTNKKKDEKYYEKIGAAGGKAVGSVKRAFAAVPGLASMASKLRFLSYDEDVKYIVKVEMLKSKTCSTREEARSLKRRYRDLGYKAKIFQ